MSEFPEVMTEEEAEQKAMMIKAAGQVAEAVNEMKLRLEALGWGMAEQAALTLFNTMMMTAFSEQMKQAGQSSQRKVKDAKERMLEITVELMEERGFAQSDGASEVVKTAAQMLLEGRPENQAAAVFEDYFGDGTKGVLFSVLTKAQSLLEKELSDDE